MVYPQPGADAGIEGYMFFVQIGEAQVWHQGEQNLVAMSGDLVGDSVAPGVVDAGDRGESAHPEPFGYTIVVTEGEEGHIAGDGIVAWRLGPG